MNSLFEIFNQKCNFYWGILTFEGRLLSGTLTVSNFVCKKSVKSRPLYGSQFGGCLDRCPSHSEFEGTKLSKGTCMNQNTTFEPLSMQFGPKLRPVGWPRKQKKILIGRRRKSRTVTFHHRVEAPFRNELHQI